MLPPPIGRIGFLGAPHNNKREIWERAACNLAAGDLYTYPKASDQLEITSPTTFKWNVDCSLDSSVDLYLYEPTAGVIKHFTGLDYTTGQYSVQLQPRWWNGTSPVQLYVTIMNSGAPVWDTQSPPGPMFQVTYDAKPILTTTNTVNGQTQTSVVNAAATESRDAVMENVNQVGKGLGISKGAIAAAVVVPLIVVAVIAAVAVRFWRAREAEKRKKWSRAVSSHSNLEWEKGAMPGEKGVPGGRASSVGGPRPGTHYSFRPGSLATSSIYAVENNMAGTGAGGNFPRPSFGHMRSYSAENLHSPGGRSSVVMPDGHVRTSRISFAETARPDRRSRLSLGDGLRPSVYGGVGKLPGASRSAAELNTPSSKRSQAYATGSAIADDEDDVNISPSQLQGPNAFHDAELKKFGQGQRTGRRSFMSLGGGDKSRRASQMSAVSADDFKSAASARGSVDELRDLEAVMLMRRSMMSQHSSRSPAVNPVDNDQVEDLEHDESNSPALPAVPAPVAAGISTVAYGPDQMLAVYAARGKVNGTAIPALPSPSIQTPQPQQGKSVMGYFKKANNTQSTTDVNGLSVPQGNKAAVRMSGQSEMSTYSDDADVGEAK